MSATNSFTVIVKEVNVAPVLPVIANQTVNELTLLTVTNTATETNIHATLGYALVNPPAGATISTNGIITWTPSQTQSPGTNMITTVVTNSDPFDLVNPHLSATNSFTVVVKEVNVAPVLPVIANADGQRTDPADRDQHGHGGQHPSPHWVTRWSIRPPGRPSAPTASSPGRPARTKARAPTRSRPWSTNSDPYDLVNPQLSATNSFTVIVKEVNVAPVLPVIADADGQ